LASLAAADARAQWTTPPVSAPGLQYRTFWSPTAQATVSFHVFVPPAYEASPADRFPTLYWLHGSGSPIAGIPTVRTWFANAMSQGRIPPMLVVFPNGMGASMWCDSKDGAVPMESVVIDDLIPHVDSSYRTIASRRGRIIEGFSMGGPGSGRLALRRPDLFAGVSMLGAGPMQLDFMDAPAGTDVPPEQRAELFERVWGSDPAYYLAEHPWTIAAQRASAHVALGMKIRLGIGSLDAGLPANEDFHAHLASLGVPHQFVVVPGVGHDPLLTMQGLGDGGWTFYLEALATPCTRAADLDCSGAVDGADLAAVLAAWGPGHGPADVNGSGAVDGVDLGRVLAAWGTVP
jgi:enterochelin esterase-like enzyme